TSVAARRPAPTPPAPQAPRRQEPTSPALRRPEPTPPAQQAPREPEPTRRPEPRGQFDLAAWVFGLVPARDPDAPPTSTSTSAPAPAARRPARPPARKALTMPDLFEGAPVPPCLDDD